MKSRIAALCAALLPAAAFAGPADLSTQAPQPAYAAPAYQAPAPTATSGVILTLRGGVASRPEYFGSDDTIAGPYFGLSIPYIGLPGYPPVGNPDPNAEGTGLSPSLSFRYVGPRNNHDNSELDGLDDIDATYELGAGLRYTSRYFKAFGETRYGFGGHNAFVGEVGADLRAHPSDRLSLRAGPRFLFGTDKYADTYFGITDSEAASSRYSSYDPEGGLISAGVEVGARYEVTDNFGLEGAVSYDRFVGDAGDSPIVEQGDRDQYGVRIGVFRHITLDF